MRRVALRPPILAFLLLIALLVAPAHRAVADESNWIITSEHWYTTELADAPAGWMQLVEEKDGETYRTTSRTQLKIGRAGASISATITSQFIESADGTPIRLDFSQAMSTQVIEVSCTFEDDSMLLVSRQGAHQTEKRLPAFEKDWLTPRQITSRFTEALKRGDDVIEYSTMDASTGAKHIDIRHERVGAETMTIDGREQPVSIWRTTNSLIPIPMSERYDAEGELVVQEMSLGFGKMTARRSTREEAMKAGNGAAPELLVSSFVKPDKPLKRLNQITRLELRVRAKEGELAELPSGGAQRVVMADDNTSALVTIDLDSRGADEGAGEGGAAEFLEPSVTINSGDEKVVQLAQRAVRGADDDPTSRAEALRAFVHRYISNKSLEVAFATAAETARTRQGDCSEHAVLLCAMLRAEGIPARVVSGLVYADSFAGSRDFFGWHMWTQAWIDDRWVDLDATLARRFHAGHIMTGASSLADGIGDADFATLITLMGQIEIDVVEVEYAAAREPSAAP
jgi:hypothetical protein